VIQCKKEPYFSMTIVNLLSVVLFLSIIFISGFYLYYHQAYSYKGFTFYNSDLPVHLKISKNIADNIFLVKKDIEPGFHVAVATISNLFGFSVNASGVLILSLFTSWLAALKLKVIHSQLQNLPTSCFFSLFLMIVSAIYLPFFSHNIYVDAGSPNVWHNPTTIMLYPFALLISLNTIDMIETYSFTKACYISFLLFATVIIKPSFAMIYLPALGIFIALFDFFAIRNYVKYSIILFPTFCFFVYQSLLFQSHHGVRFAPYAVIRLYSSNPIVSIFLGLAFPLSILVFRMKKITTQLKFIWILLIIAYVQFALLAESSEFSAGNFGWGYQIALSLIFLFSFVELLKWVHEIGGFKQALSNLKILTCFGIFSIHLVSGIIYVHRIWLGQSYY